VLTDWDEDMMARLGRVEPLTEKDREYVANVLNAAISRIEKWASVEEVHWPLPRPAMFAPGGEGLWLSRWPARRARRLP
jgi:hypothetical protein